jgi:NAD(P)-dependent dehydrogenase (short-subunit alcohol dehydrogenase family)
MSAPVLFVIGGTGKVGAASATRFAREGYRVALASRSATPGPRLDDGVLLVKLDVSKPNDVEGAFETVVSHFGQGPSVVVYNGVWGPGRDILAC